MTTFADALKSEIARIARKELKSDLLGLRKTVSAQRTEIAALKKSIKQMDAKLKLLARAQKARPQAAAAGGANAGLAASGRQSNAVVAVPAGVKRGRRSTLGPATLAAFRAKMGISQAQLATLLGVSTLSVHKWESAKAQPRAAQIAKMAPVLKLGKRAVVAQLRTP